MTTALFLTFDMVAICVLVYGVYFVRHRRRDMLIAYLALNVGTMSVTLVLANASVAAGLGLGLFGVLSIIRLRSSPLTQEEVAYYFASLALGLISGLQPSPAWVVPAVGTLIVLVMFIADHPRLYANNRHQIVTLDAAITNESELERRLDALLDADIQRAIVSELDLVRDVTVVDVRFRVRPGQHKREVAPPRRPVSESTLLPADAR